MLLDIKGIVLTFLFLCGCFGSFVFGQEPSTRPSTQATTQPSSTQPTTQPVDSVGLTIDSTGVSADSTRIGRKPPPKKRLPPPPIVLGDEVYYFHIDQPKEVFEFVDTTIHSAFFQYDHARTGQYDYATLGAIGGPLQSLHYRWEDKYGTRIGIDEVFKPYILDESDIVFYTDSKAFTNVYYSQGVEQNDHRFRGDFGRSFDNGIKFSIRHDRLIHSLNNPDLTLNTNAFVAFPSAKNTSLLTGLAFQKEGSKYQGFLTYAHNEVNQIYNGGLLTNDTIIPIETIDANIENAASFDVGIAIQVNLQNDNATLRYRFRNLAYEQYLTLAGQKDSTSTSGRIFNLNHKIKYVDDLYRFADTRFNDDYYQNLATDDRGIRVAYQQRITENYIGLSTLKTEKGKVVPSVLGDIRLGLRHQFALIDGEGFESRTNNLFAEGSWKVTPFKALTANVFGQIGLLENIGDFRLDASASLSLNQWGILKGRLRQQRFSPSIFEQRNFVTQIEVWNNEFNKSFNSELGFSYQLPRFEFEAGLSFFLLDNHIYYDAQFVPLQRSGAINLLQIHLKKNFNWKILHLENLVMLQTSTDNDVIKLPSWWSRHSLYIQRRIFRNDVMLARFGLDLRLSDSYFANNFNPALGQFYVQSEREVALYPSVDAHFGFVIDKFRVFVKMENLTSVITDDIFYQIPFYPQKELAFRFGISWRFLDRHNIEEGNNNQNNRGNNPTSRPSTGGGRPRF